MATPKQVRAWLEQASADLVASRAQAYGEAAVERLIAAVKEELRIFARTPK